MIYRWEDRLKERGSVLPKDTQVADGGDRIWIQICVATKPMLTYPYLPLSTNSCEQSFLLSPCYEVIGTAYNMIPGDQRNSNTNNMHLHNTFYISKHLYFYFLLSSSQRCWEVANVDPFSIYNT